MKKIKPSSGYDDHEGYPSVTGDGADRRGFLKAALAGGAALGGSLLLSSDADSRKKRKYHGATFNLRGYYNYYPCRYRARSLNVQTTDKRFAAFVTNNKHQARIEKAIAPILKAAKCTDVQDTKNLAKLHKKLARALAAHYRRQSKRRVRQPIVTLILRRVRMPVPGGIRRPPRPHP